MLRHIVEEAAGRGYRRLSLETGSQPHFMPARRLYQSFGFQECGPFGDYVLSPHSTFLTLDGVIFQVLSTTATYSAPSGVV